MKSRGRSGWLAALVVPGLFLLHACATRTESLRREAAALGYLGYELPGNAYRLSAFFKPAATKSRTLHVYLEGDGQPWASRYRVAADPTPGNPVMLRLMAEDPCPALYLGRPCYMGHAGDPGCSPLVWTHRRYAPEIIDAMAVALRQFMRDGGYLGPTFMGHSGGGALALLLAERFPGTRAVVTLGANLDIDAWASHHGYTLLEGSLNPAHAVNSGHREFHYYGDRDKTTPPELFESVVAKRPHARLVAVPGYDHHCCWERLWPEILRMLAAGGEDCSR